MTATKNTTAKSTTAKKDAIAKREKDTLAILVENATGVKATHIEQYFGPWCILPDRFVPMVERVQGLDLLAHIESRRNRAISTVLSGDSDSNDEYEMIGSIALIHATGSLTKYGNSFDGSSSTVALRRQIRNAADDECVGSILLRIESPGGTTAGTQELAEEIVAATAKKPVYAYCEDLCASAAYWIASQCTKVYANASSLVGCIGTYTIVQDASAMMEKMGVKVNVVKAGDFKAAGTFGTPVTDDQLAEFQRLVDTLNGFFLGAVEKGRKLTAAKVKELADGRVHVGKEAAANGLIDGIRTFEETINELSLASKGKQMSETQNASPATLGELKAAIPGATSDFIVKALESGMTVPDAVSAWSKQLATENEALKLRVKALEEKKDDEEEEEEEEEEGDGKAEGEKQSGKGKANGKKSCGDSGKAKSRHAPGLRALSEQRSTRQRPADAISAFNAEVQDWMKQGKSRHEAVKIVARTNPTLHSEYLAADPRNQGDDVQRLIGERFAG